jgi:protoporphyrinogen IX oxidase
MTFTGIAYTLHVYGIVLWVAGLVAVTMLLDAAHGETDPAAKKRLGTFARKVARLPDLGATLALIFGLHILFSLKMYRLHYMHAKLLFVAILIGLHGFVRVKTKQAAEGKDVAVPWFRPVMGLVVLAIVFFVMTKFPT